MTRLIGTFSRVVQRYGSTRSLLGQLKLFSHANTWIHLNRSIYRTTTDTEETQKRNTNVIFTTLKMPNFWITRLKGSDWRVNSSWKNVKRRDEPVKHSRKRSVWSITETLPTGIGHKVVEIAELARVVTFSVRKEKKDAQMELESQVRKQAGGEVRVHTGEQRWVGCRGGSAKCSRCKP